MVPLSAEGRMLPWQIARSALLQTTLSVDQTPWRAIKKILCQKKPYQINFIQKEIETQDILQPDHTKKTSSLKLEIIALNYLFF